MKLDYRDHWSHQSVIHTKSGLTLSIIAGDRAYSCPSYKTTDGEYTEVEIGVFCVWDESHRIWASGRQLKTLGVFDIIGYGEFEQDGLLDSPQSYVFGYVPIEQVERLIEHLNS